MPGTVSLFKDHSQKVLGLCEEMSSFVWEPIVIVSPSWRKVRVQACQGQITRCLAKGVATRHLLLRDQITGFLTKGVVTRWFEY